MLVLLVAGPVGGLPADDVRAALQQGWARGAPADVLSAPGGPDDDGEPDLVLVAVDVLGAEALAPGGELAEAAGTAAAAGAPLLVVAREVRAGARECGAAGVAEVHALPAGTSPAGEGVARAVADRCADLARTWSPS